MLTGSFTCIGVRLLRACFKMYLDAAKPIAIGNRWEVRAFLIPMPKHDRYNTAERKKAFRIARKAFEDMLRELERD